MANVKLLFYGTETSGTEEHMLEVFLNNDNEIFIEIDMQDNNRAHLCLDKSTAIKLHRELKKQISFIED